MNTKKLGIITITNGPDNYGNVLQNFAVQTILNDIDFTSETIRNYSFVEYRQTSLYLLPKMIRFPLRAKKSLKFLLFSKKYIRYSRNIITRDNKNIHLLKNKYYKFICGSDQVWNPSFDSNKNWTFNLLKFAAPTQKIAFAASFGIHNFKDKYFPIFQGAFDDFHAISVRENSAVSLVKELSGRDCIVLLDPTMTVEASQWKSICKPVKSLRKKLLSSNMFWGISTPISRIVLNKFKVNVKSKLGL